MELGAVWGLRELADGHVFDDEDKWRVADAIEPGQGALIALVEHRWAIPVREAVRRAGGHAVAGRWIAEHDLIRLGETSMRIRLALGQPVATQAAVSCCRWQGRGSCGNRSPVLFARGSSARRRTPSSSGDSTSSSAQASTSLDAIRSRPRPRVRRRRAADAREARLRPGACRSHRRLTFAGSGRRASRGGSCPSLVRSLLLLTRAGSKLSVETRAATAKVRSCSGMSFPRPLPPRRSFSRSPRRVRRPPRRR